MARNGIWNLLKELDRVGGSAALVGPIACAEQVVRDMQERGPRWSGEFSNSWQITGPQGQTVRGTGTPGQPRPIEFTSAPFTGRQALFTRLSKTLLKDKMVFTISNFSPHADEARDLVPYTPPPETGDINFGSPLKQRKYGTRPTGGRRGELSGAGNNSSTAPLDWYSNYFGGGQFGKTIQINMDRTFRTIR